MQWSDKNFWVNAEALYTLALTALVKDDQTWFDHFIKQHEWCQKYFYDPEYGEWYAELNRDGSVKNPDKGTMWKSAYHVPRALLFTYKAMDRYLADRSSRRVEKP